MKLLPFTIYSVILGLVWYGVGYHGGRLSRPESALMAEAATPAPSAPQPVVVVRATPPPATPVRFVAPVVTPVPQTPTEAPPMRTPGLQGTSLDHGAYNQQRSVAPKVLRGVNGKPLNMPAH